MLTEIKRTEQVEVHALHQDQTALQELVLELVGHLVLDLQDHQLRQEHQRLEILVAAQEAVQQLEILHLAEVVEAVERHEVQVDHLEVRAALEALALEVQEVLAAREALVLEALQEVLVGHLHQEEADDNRDKS